MVNKHKGSFRVHREPGSHTEIKGSAATTELILSNKRRWEAAVRDNERERWGERVSV